MLFRYMINIDIIIIVVVYIFIIINKLISLSFYWYIRLIRAY